MSIAELAESGGVVAPAPSMAKAETQGRVSFRAADAFSAGIMLHEMFTGGEAPLPDYPNGARMGATGGYIAIDPSEVAPLPRHVPTTAASLVRALLRPDPRARPPLQSALQVLETATADAVHGAAGLRQPAGGWSREQLAGAVAPVPLPKDVADRLTEEADRRQRERVARLQAEAEAAAAAAAASAGASDEGLGVDQQAAGGSGSGAGTEGEVQGPEAGAAGVRSAAAPAAEGEGSDSKVDDEEEDGQGEDGEGTTGGSTAAGTAAAAAVAAAGTAAGGASSGAGQSPAAGYQPASRAGGGLSLLVKAVGGGTAHITLPPGATAGDALGLAIEQLPALQEKLAASGLELGDALEQRRLVLLHAGQKQDPGADLHALGLAQESAVFAMWMQAAPAAPPAA